MSKKKFFIIGGAVAVAIAAAIFYFLRKDISKAHSTTPSEMAKTSESDSLPSQENNANKEKERHLDKEGGSRPSKRSDKADKENKTDLRSESSIVHEEVPLTQEEQKLYDDIQEAMDSDKASDVIKFCSKITSLSKRELREQAVSALGWFDGKTMAELTPFLADPDEDIAADALFQWQEALNQIESEVQRADIVSQAMKILQDENALEQLSMELNFLDEKLAVETLVGIISGDNPAGIKVGKDAYEFITGEKYTNPEGANNWIKENYTPPQ
jgi:hypothetical protein